MEKEKVYPYYGAQCSDITAIHEIYPGIHTPKELYDALYPVWCLETCSADLKPQWSLANRTLGQCSITALIAQDLFGGDVYEMHLKNGAIHCYNVVDNKCFDLTSEQFGEKAGNLRYEGNFLQNRQERLSDPIKKERYENLKRRLALATNSQ